MFNVLKIKLELLKYYSKEKVYVCGNKVFDEILSSAGTIMPTDAERLLDKKFRVELPESYDAIAYGKVWIRSDLLKEDFVMPLSKTIQLLREELERLRRNE